MSKHKKGEKHVLLAFLPFGKGFVGAAGFELATFWSQTRRANRAALRPEGVAICKKVSCTQYPEVVLLNKYISAHRNSTPSLIDLIFVVVVKGEKGSAPRRVVTSGGISHLGGPAVLLARCNFDGFSVDATAGMAFCYRHMYTQ